MDYLVNLIGFFATFIFGIRIVVIAISTLIVTIYVSVFIFFISMIVRFHTMVSDLLTYSSSYSASGVEKFFGLLHCVGFSDALYASLPLITTSLIMLLSAVFYRLVLLFVAKFYPLIRDVVK